MSFQKIAPPIFTKTKNSSILGHHYFTQKPRCTSQIKFKGIMAPTVPKFGLALCEGADGTAGVLAGSPAAAKRKKTAEEYGLLDLKTAQAAKLAAKPIVAPPPYKGQDLNIDGHDGLDVLDRLNELQGASP
jgi:hypothetical protein